MRAARDGGGIDVWVGSLPERALTAIIRTVDMGKREAEIKLLLGCTEPEQQIVLPAHTAEAQSALLCVRPQATQAETMNVSDSGG